MDGCVTDIGGTVLLQTVPVAVEIVVTWTDGCVTDVVGISLTTNNAGRCGNCGCGWTDGCMTDVGGISLVANSAGWRELRSCGWTDGCVTDVGGISLATSIAGCSQRQLGRVLAEPNLQQPGSIKNHDKTR